MDLFNCINTFVTIVDCGSFAKAAKELHTSSSVVSKRLNFLEDKLNVQLVNRTTRSSELSAAGEEFYPRALEMINEWKNIQHDVHNLHKKKVDILTIFLANTFASAVTPSIVKLMEIHPEINVRIKSYYSHDDVLSPEADLVFWTELENAFLQLNSLEKQELVPSKVKLFASKEYLRSHDQITQISDLATHNIIGNIFPSSFPYWSPPLLDENGDKLVLNSRLDSNSFFFSLLASEENSGIICMPEQFLRMQLKYEQIEEVLPDIDLKIPDFRMFCYYPKRSRHKPIVEKFIKLLKQDMRETFPDSPEIESEQEIDADRIEVKL